MTPFLYRLLLAAITPLAVPILLGRALWKGHPRNRILEKLGRLDASLHSTEPGAIWLHAVSVGEALSAASLIPHLRTALPGRSIFVSTSTPTGQDMARSKLGTQVEGIFYAPHDFPWAVRGTLAALKPRLLLVMETEIWPNLFGEARRFGAGLVIANGRISDRSAPKYAARRKLFGPPLRACDAILAQSQTDAERFIASGADPRSVSVGGNLKYDFTPPSSGPPAVVAGFLERIGAGPVIVAGSTREDEEAPVARAFNELAKSRPHALLVVAPRHPGRFDEAAEALAGAGLPVAKRSDLTDKTALGLPGILLLDSLGELASVYSLADAVFVGGSLNGWGGHNVLEPALSGKPVVTGPHTQNFRAIVERLSADGGLVQIGSAEELAPACARLLDEPEYAREVAERGQTAAEAERGAAERIAAAAATAWQEAAPSNPPVGWKRAGLTPAAWAWRIGNAVDRRTSRRKRLPRPVVSIGNLSAGGTGKTPTAFRLLRELSLRGHRPALLTRGYRRRSLDKVIVAGPHDPYGPAHLGDEPAELFRRFRAAGLEVPIGVGSDRHATGKELLERFPDVDLFVLDDGFQHYRLEREFDLVLIDAAHPPDADEPLPLGRLREGPEALARADAILLMRAHPELGYASLLRRLRIDEKPVFRGRRAPVEVVDGVTDQPAELSTLRGVKAFAFCGIGDPSSFFESLDGLGVEIVGREAFSDHHRYEPEDWWRIAKTARDAEAEILLTTEKDLANLDAGVPAPTRSGAPRLKTLRIDLRIDDASSLIDRIEEAIG